MAEKKLKYKEVGGEKKVKAPDGLEEVNAPVHVKRRKEKAKKRRPEWVE